MQPIESLIIAGEEAELASFVVPEMSLSSARSTMTPQDFTLTIRSAAMIEFLGPAYDGLVRDLKQDDAAMGGPQDPLAEAGYPDLASLSENCGLLLIVLGQYLLAEFIGALSWDGSGPAKYWLDRVIRCEASNGTIRLFGVCYKRADQQP